MDLEELKNKISLYKTGDTWQSWRKDSSMFYENEYIKVVRLDSSNVTGGSNVHNGKQWSIIIDIKKPFLHLENWKKLFNAYKYEIDITPVRRGINKGCYGIRLYNMSVDPTNEIIKSILDYIFENIPCKCIEYVSQ